MIGILGGTFDPVHHGHLRIALELLQGLSLDEVRFIPCRNPPHRGEAVASPRQRLAMLERAIAGQRGFVIDDRELARPGLSYMVDTLESLRNNVGDTPLCMIVGRDAFNRLDTWHRWRQLIELAHIIVAERPDVPGPPSPAVAELLEGRRVDAPVALHGRAAGSVLTWPVTRLSISATLVREVIAAGHSPRYLVPDTVWSYIQKESLYR